MARQIVRAGQAVLDKGEAFCAEQGMAPQTLIDMRLAPDMAALPLPFVVSDFLMSFSQPNVYFHASMLYAILLHAGVTLGKIDFPGRIRLAR